MERRGIAKSGLSTAPIMFGGNVFGWTIDEAASFRILDEFVGRGFNAIDTADIYANWVPGNSGGESETIIGKWMKLRGNRDKILVATKVGKPMSPDKKGLSRRYILQEVEESLRRLQTDFIDLYQSHDDDLTTPVEETLEAYAGLVAAGKVRAIGVSNISAVRLNDGLAASKRLGLPAYVSAQPYYNLYDRDEYEKGIEPACVSGGLSVFPYFSLASGFLTGKYRSEKDFSKSTRGRGMTKYLNERGFRILAALDHLAKQYGATPASIALAWLLAHPGITAPIASATKSEHLDDFVRATELRLDPTALELLTRL